jgi:hypothetical protein
MLATQTPMAEEQKAIKAEERAKHSHMRQAEAFREIVNSEEFVKPSESAAEAEVKVDIANKGIGITRQLYEDEPDRLGYETLVEFTKHRNMRQQELEDFTNLEATRAQQQELEGFTNLEATKVQQKQQNATAMANIHKAIEWSRQQDWNDISRSLDLSNLDERTIPRLERAFKRAERDTKYLKKEDTE